MLKKLLQKMKFGFAVFVFDKYICASLFLPVTYETIHTCKRSNHSVLYSRVSSRHINSITTSPVFTLGKKCSIAAEKQ